MRRSRSNAARITWQATARNKFTGYIDLQDRLTGHWFVGQGGIFGLTAPEASWRQTTPIGHLWQTKWTSTASSKMMLERHQQHLRAALLCQIDTAVADRFHARAAALLVVRLIEIIAAGQQ